MSSTNRGHDSGNNRRTFKAGMDNIRTTNDIHNSHITQGRRRTSSNHTRTQSGISLIILKRVTILDINRILNHNNDTNSNRSARKMIMTLPRNIISIVKPMRAPSIKSQNCRTRSKQRSSSKSSKSGTITGHLRMLITNSHIRGKLTLFSSNSRLLRTVLLEINKLTAVMTFNIRLPGY